VKKLNFFYNNWCTEQVYYWPSYLPDSVSVSQLVIIFYQPR